MDGQVRLLQANKGPSLPEPLLPTICGFGQESATDTIFLVDGREILNVGIPTERTDVLLSLLIIVIGFALLVFGANWLVDGACRLAERLGVPDRVAGLTIVAVGTSLPELVVSVTSAMSGHADMAVGNVAGSCLANLLLILGLSAAIKPVALSRDTQRFEVPVTVGACVLLALLANIDGQITALEGVVLLVAYAAFVARTVVSGLSEGAGEKDAGPDAATTSGGLVHTLRDLALIALGIVMLKVGADFVVESATDIALTIGVSERIVGLTVVALGTSLPELVTSVVAALRGNSDIAVGNVVGSNITNLLLVMGAPALFANVAFDLAYNVDLALIAIFSVALVGFALTGRRHVMSRANGAAFLALYGAYLIVSVLG